MAIIRVDVPASSANLGPGFDVLGMALRLYNTIEMERIPQGLVVEVEGEGVTQLKRDETNLVVVAARRLFRKVGIPESIGLKIHLTNRIPIGSGLGSSASATVGGLLAANLLLGEPLSPQALLNLATEIEGHPDNVAPALLGGIVISLVNQGCIETLHFRPPADLVAVVAVPDINLSTADARKALPAQIDRSDAVFNLSRACMLVAAVAQGRADLMGQAMEDRLHQPYRDRLIPGMGSSIEKARQAGAMGAALSGAGPSVLAICRTDRQEAVAAAMKQAFATAGIGTRMLILEPSVSGAVHTLHPVEESVS